MKVRVSVAIASVSLFVELLRTRPLSLFWAMAAVQVVLWTLVPVLFYSAPPGQLPVTLAIGHEFQFGTEFGPPLAFWVAELAFRAAGLFGVYLLSQLCMVATYAAVLSLGRAIVGDAHAVMAVLLMAGVAVFSVPTPEFGPAVLAAPLWAWMLCHYWRAAEKGEWALWLVVGVEAGLLLLTSYAGLILVGLLVAYMLSNSTGRAHLSDIGPWAAGLVTTILLFPYLTWIDLTGGVAFPDTATIVQNLRTWGWLIAVLLVGHAGLGFMIVLGRGYVVRSRDAPPEVSRPPIAPGARGFVYFFALTPIVAIGLFAVLTRRPEAFVGAPLVVLSGLAAVVAAGDRIRIEHQYLIGLAWSALMVLPPLLVALVIMVQPWTFAIDLRVGRPAVEIAQFFSDSVQRRTGRPLAIVAGDPPIAALVSLLSPSRPSLYLESSPAYLPRVSRQDIEEKGGVVLWPTTDISGRPPLEVLRQFPNLVPEVPQTFERRFQGRMSLLRIGWAMIRPGSPSAAPEPRPQVPEQSEPQLPPQPMPELPPSPIPESMLPRSTEPAPAPAPASPPPPPQSETDRPARPQFERRMFERHRPQ